MEFIEEIEEIANAKPTTENELEKAKKQGKVTHKRELTILCPLTQAR